MGSDDAELDLSGIDEKRAMRMIGESLHLGCIGAVFYYVFLSECGPWWKSPSKAGMARPVQTVGVSASSSSQPVPPVRKRVRRTGCLSLSRVGDS
jgi:hypothetical protein